jgi:hypothetical protein
MGALWLSNGGLGGSKMIVGRWSSDPLVGSKAANPWLRARIARVGILALSKEETLYFDRTADEAGNPFRENCRYRLSGKPIATRWWSLTIYGKDQFLPRNLDSATSIDATRALPAGASIWTGMISSFRPADSANWMSSRAAGNFSITLRLYNPSTVEADALARMDFPTVTLVDCSGTAQGGVTK